MNDTERKWFNELVTTKMNEIVQKVAEKKDKQPEPQAGDVWQSPCYTVFIHKDSNGVLDYVYEDGTRKRHKLEDIIPAYPYTRIFSLTEYLKDKEEEGK